MLLVYGVKLIGAVIVPVLALLFIETKDIVKPRTRIIGLSAGILVEVGALVAVWRVASFMGGEKANTAIADIAIIIVGAVFSAVVLYVKRKPTAPAAAPPPPPPSYQRAPGANGGNAFGTGGAGD